MSDESSEGAGANQPPKDPPRPPPDKSWVKTQKGTYSREPGETRPSRPRGTIRDR